MKNILITFTNAIDPTTGGVERVYHNLVPYFREHGYNVFATYQRKTASIPKRYLWSILLIMLDILIS